MECTHCQYRLSEVDYRKLNEQRFENLFSLSLSSAWSLIHYFKGIERFFDIMEKNYPEYIIPDVFGRHVDEFKLAYDLDNGRGEGDKVGQVCLK